MKVRTATLGDLDALNRIALQAKAHWGYSSEQLGQWRDDLTTRPASIATSPTLVAEVQGAVVAFGQLNAATTPWDLCALWVLPEFMGKGIGSRLLSELASIAEGAGQSSLQIDADPHALGFYMARGAARVGDVAAPIAGEPTRVRPQLLLPTRPAQLSREPGMREWLPDQVDADEAATSGAGTPHRRRGPKGRRGARTTRAHAGSQARRGRR